MPSRRTSFYLADTVEERLPQSETLAGGINRACDRYAELIERTPMPAFTKDERGLLQESVAAARWEPAGNIADLSSIVAEAVDDGLHVGWEVDAPAFVERLEALTYAQKLRIAHELEGGFRKVDA